MARIVTAIKVHKSGTHWILYAAATLGQFKTFTYISTTSNCMHVNVLCVAI